jgi:hypothetical protein
MKFVNNVNVKQCSYQNYLNVAMGYYGVMWE